MIYIFIFILLIIFSAFFSGSETAYFHLRKHSNKTPKKILSILKHPRRLLVSILTGNTLANVAIASLAAYITHKYAQQHNWNESTLILIEVLIVSAIVLICLLAQSKYSLKTSQAKLKELQEKHPR